VNLDFQRPKPGVPPEHGPCQLAVGQRQFLIQLMDDMRTRGTSDQLILALKCFEHAGERYEHAQRLLDLVTSLESALFSGSSSEVSC